jgi:hypothetical protein
MARPKIKRKGADWKEFLGSDKELMKTRHPGYAVRWRRKRTSGVCGYSAWRAGCKLARVERSDTPGMRFVGDRTPDGVRGHQCRLCSMC